MCYNVYYILRHLYIQIFSLYTYISACVIVLRRTQILFT